MFTWLAILCFYEKAIWKPGIAKIAKGGLTAPPWTHSCNGKHADAHWFMAYINKTQSFVKNGGQQNCLRPQWKTLKYKVKMTVVVNILGCYKAASRENRK